ncbi:DUF7504 family protein [Halorarius litoreus]|uniref:DUF7504 family protein n=1 Tax=Halorarius litoreus TaxID=2962676 RepID=UPI0020CBFB6F|nr:hypothetical protein [Halorarius litoreus]
MGEGTKALDEFTVGSNVLLLGPAVDGEVDDGCRRLLHGGPDVDRRSMLVVTFTLSPRQWVDRWDDHVGERPRELIVVTTSDTFGGPNADTDVDGNVQVEYLSSPGDLTGLGMIISKYLERWHAEDRRMALCFDSLTALLQYEELHNVYRFLHLMTTRLAGADAHAHFHLDPATQDDKTVSTLSSTFDALARYDDGDWDVRSR